jgi:hypothetical protein
MMLKHNTVIHVKEKSLFDEMNATDPDSKYYCLLQIPGGWNNLRGCHGFQDSCQATDLRALN